MWKCTDSLVWFRSETGLIAVSSRKFPCLKYIQTFRSTRRHSQRLNQSQDPPSILRGPISCSRTRHKFRRLHFSSLSPQSGNLNAKSWANTCSSKTTAEHNDLDTPPIRSNTCCRMIRHFAAANCWWVTDLTPFLSSRCIAKSQQCKTVCWIYSSLSLFTAET